MQILRRTKLISDTELAALLKLFEAGTTVDDSKTIHFNHLDSDELERILPDAFEGDPSFTQRQMRNLLREALWNCRKNGMLNNDGLLAEAEQIAKKRIAQPPQQYEMWTKFRARQMAFSEGFRLEWNGVSLKSADRLPDYMLKDDYFINGHGHIQPHEPVFFGHLITRCKAREEENAVVQMLDATSLFMALFNMYEMWGKWSIGGERWAQGRLWNGPYHFVFRGKEFLGQERVWYDPNFSAETWAVHPIDMKDVLRRIPRVRDALAALAGHPLQDVLMDVLRLMQNAMSSRDQSYTLLRYWSALERLYSEPNNGVKNYSRIIERASFAEHDRNDKMIAQWKLSHISRLRNEYVHARDHDDDLHVMAHYLRRLLSRHVHSLLFHTPKVHDHAHWLEIVDLPDDEEKLAGRKALIDQRMEIIRQRHSGND